MPGWTIMLSSLELLTLLTLLTVLTLLTLLTLLSLSLLSLSVSTDGAEKVPALMESKLGV